MRPIVLVLAAVTLAPLHEPPRTPPAPERAAVNRNLRPAGSLRDGVLTLRLEARRARWHPEGDDGIGIDVHAFAVAGRAPEIPGPLVRVPVGTEVRLLVRNALDSTLVLHGMHARPVAAGDTVQVAPGAAREVSFRLREVGTFLYWGRTTADTSVEAREGADGQLTGAIVVDSAGALPGRDRVLVVGVWARPPADPAARDAPWGLAVALNGKAWPHTERLHLTVGDTVRWRVVNASPRPHPMHLHGFYFDVESRGDGTRDSTYGAVRQRRAVTELMVPRSTMAMRWVPERPGNWLFHCHFAAHVGPRSRLFAPHGGADPRTVVQAAAASDRASAAHDGHAAHGMFGLVLGLHVRDTATAPVVAAAAARAPRQLRLLINERPRVYGAAPGLSYVLQSGEAAPAPDSLALPGSTLVLARGEPVRVTVVNRTSAATAVHWHGLEIESFPDGVPGWSGAPGKLMPAIAPADSFVAAFTPPRAGTFMYHAHLDEGRQIGSGLYGALIVVDPDAARDAREERLLVFSRGGPGVEPDAPSLVNGRAPADTVALAVGVAHRLRLVLIHPNGQGRLRLRAAGPRDSSLAVWRPLAKDGADLPPAQARPRAASALVAMGETYDVEFTPPVAGPYLIEFVMPRGPVVTRVPLRAR